MASPSRLQVATRLQNLELRRGRLALEDFAVGDFSPDPQSNDCGDKKKNKCVIHKRLQNTGMTVTIRENPWIRHRLSDFNVDKYINLC